MAKYKVKGTDILYNGKLYEEGKTITLEDEEAKQLTDYLELIPEKPTKQGKPTKELETPAKDSTNADNAGTDNTSGDGGTQ